MGRRKGEREAPGGGGGSILIEYHRRGGLQEGEGLRGREGVCGELGNGGGANFFVFGAEMSTMPIVSKKVASDSVADCVNSSPPRSPKNFGGIS